MGESLPGGDYSRIFDNYSSLQEVISALDDAGLQSANLIIGVDFTCSNTWAGMNSYNGRSLHDIGTSPNPYEQAISIIGKTLAAFDDDNVIPCYGFGDAWTQDRDVFSFHTDETICVGLEQVLVKYREIVPQLKLAGPTSFAPIIEMAMTIVEGSGGEYHVLLIIADGQITRSVDTEIDELSEQERQTIDAIVEASKYPLSIVVVGVGDGPWDRMKTFDDNIPDRAFDNFQFVNFTEIMSRNLEQDDKEAAFALEALMEIPQQFQATVAYDLWRRRRGTSPGRVALPPRIGCAYIDIRSHASSSHEGQDCPICWSSSKDMAFGCGHQTCRGCGEEIQTCPICRSRIETRIRLY